MVNAEEADDKSNVITYGAIVRALWEKGAMNKAPKLFERIELMTIALRQIRSHTI